MRRILLMVLRNLLIVPGGWIKLCYRASHVDKYTEEDNFCAGLFFVQIKAEM